MYFNHEKFKLMREVGNLTSLCLDELKGFIKPGISTEDINQFVFSFQNKHNLQNAQYGYFFNNIPEKYKFPGYCCTSLNEVLCHGIPSKKDILKEGDLVKVDITFIKNGYHGDACRTYPVGNISPEARTLILVAEGALHVGIQQCYFANKVRNIGAAIEEYVNNNGMWVAGDFVGHGIGKRFHEFFSVPHILSEDISFSFPLQIGQTFTVEPIVCLKKSRFKTAKDKWTVQGNKLAAQFEATVGINQVGKVEIFCQ